MQERVLIDCKSNKNISIMKAHYHCNIYEVLYIAEGSVVLEAGGAQYEMNSDMMAFIGAGEIHAVKANRQPPTYYHALIHASYMDKMIEEPKLLSVFKNRSVNFYHCVDLTGQKKSVHYLFESMLREFQQPTVFSNELLGGYVKELLVTAYRETPQAFSVAGNRINPAIEEAKVYIDKHYTDVISLQELARRFFLSADYLSHGFKDYTGYSPQQYILQRRLRRSKELLLNTGETVGTIAYLSGFSDVNSFIRVFKKYVGQTPNKYRSA